MLMQASPLHMNAAADFINQRSCVVDEKYENNHAQSKLVLKNILKDVLS